MKYITRVEQLKTPLTSLSIIADMPENMIRRRKKPFPNGMAFLTLLKIAKLDSGVIVIKSEAVNIV